MPDLSIQERFGQNCYMTNPGTTNPLFNIYIRDFDNGAVGIKDGVPYDLGDLGDLGIKDLTKFPRVNGDTTGWSSKLFYAMLLKSRLNQAIKSVDDPTVLMWVEETPLRRIVERGGVQQIEYSFTVSFYQNLLTSQPNASEVL